MGFMRFLKYLSLCAALLGVACAQDDIISSGAAEQHPSRELVVAFEADDTRVQLNDDRKTVWTNDDRVAVYYASGRVEEWMYNGATGERYASLVPVSNSTASDSDTMMAMAYPYNSDFRFDVAGSSLKAMLPATQNYLAGSYGVGANLMVGNVGNPTTMRNVCGWLRLEVTGNGEKVMGIALRGNRSEQVSGEIIVDVEDASSKLTEDSSKAYGVVVLDCGDGVTLSAKATTFYIALPPQKFSKGLNVELLCSNAEVMTQTTENSITISRNVITPMESFAFKADSQEVSEGFYPSGKEVWYKTYSGGLMSINGSPFNATVKSNKTVELCVNDMCRIINCITCDKTVTSVEAMSFLYSELETIYLPHSVTSIGATSFLESADLYEVHFGKGLKSIGQGAFANCSYLRYIYCRAAVPPTIGEYAFLSDAGSSYNYVGARIYVPAQSVALYKSAPGWSKFANYIVGYDFVKGEESSVVIGGDGDEDDEYVDDGTFNGSNFNHRLLLIDHTGMDCGYCPEMTDRLHALSESKYANYYYEVQCHGGGYATGGDPGYSAAAAVVDAFHRGKRFVSGYPTACVNFLYGSVSRGNTDYVFVRNMGNVFNAVRNNFGAEAGIAISSKIESNKIKVDIEVTSAKSQNYKVTAWVLENDIYSPNQNGATSALHRTYNHVLRAIGGAYSSSDISGDALGRIAAGEKATKSFTIDLNSSWVKSNLEVLVIVSAPNADGEYEVVNTALCPANDSCDYEPVQN